MSRTLIALLWAGTVLIAPVNTALAAAELGDAMTIPRDMTAAWFDIRMDDDVFVQPAHGRFGVEPAPTPTAGFTALLGEAVTIGEFSVTPYSSLIYTRPYDDTFGGPTSYAAQDSLIGAIGLKTSGRFDTGMGTLETLINLYLAHELDIDGVRFKTLPGALRRNIRFEPVDPEQFDFENALSFRIKGMVPGYFHYETRVRVRSTGLREVTAGIRIRW